MEFEIKNIHLWSLFKISFFIMVVLIFLILALLGNQFLAMSAQLQGMESFPGFDGKLTISLMIFGAVSNALFFSVMMVAAGALYNFFSRTFGGIKIELHGDFVIEEEIIEPESQSVLSEKEPHND